MDFENLLKSTNNNSDPDGSDDLFDHYSQDVSHYDCNIEQKENAKERTKREELYKIGSIACAVGGVVVLSGKAIKLISRIIED